MPPETRRRFLATLGLGAMAGLGMNRAWATTTHQPWRADEAKLYAALDDDERAGRPLLATVLVNLTYYGRFTRLDRNMYWSGRGGYAGYFKTFRSSQPASRRLGSLRWKALPTPDPPPAGATAHALFRAPLARPVYLVVLGYADGGDAIRRVIEASRDAAVRLPLATPEGPLDAFQDARLLGFAGHNPAYDDAIGPGPVPTTPRSRTVATFAIGCCTGGTVPACQPFRVVPWLAHPATVPLLFSDSLMTGEAFSFQAMLTGLLDRLPLARVVDRANDEYQRVLNRDGERHGRPFTPLRRLYASLGR